MTMQIPDIVIYKKEKYNFLNAENIYSLFNPIEYGFRPVMMHTACYRGYIIIFRIDEDNNLILDSLLVNDKNHHYEDINGVKANITDIEFGEYKDINLILSRYTGIITIAKDLKDNYRGRTFVGPNAYELVYELKIENGKLVEQRDTSGMYDFF